MSDDKLRASMLDPIIAGALYDLMGWLTSREQRLVLSSTDLAAPACDALVEWARLRGLSLNDAHVEDWRAVLPAPTAEPIDMVLHCPACGMQHVDAPDEDGHAHAHSDGRESRWTNPPHRSHLCHACGLVWRPADVPTNGVAAVKTRGKNDSAIVAPRAAPPAEPDDGWIVDDARERFEGWCRRRWSGDRGALTLREDGQYHNGHVEFAWCAWQAATQDGIVVERLARPAHEEG